MLENHLRGILKAFGRKVGKVDQARFEQRVRELVDGDNILEQVVGSMLRCGGRSSIASTNCIGSCWPR